MERFPRTRLLAVLTVFLFLPWAAAASSLDVPPRQLLRFQLAAFDPLNDPLPEGALLEDFSARGPFLVQFPYPLTGAEMPLVERAGGEVAAYLPDGAFVVVGSAGLARALRDLPSARWVGLLPSSLRLHPAAPSASALSLSYAGAPASLLAELDSLSAEPLVLGRASALVHPGFGGARALAALPHVLWVEPYREPESANYRAVLTDKIRQFSNASSFSTASGALWAFNADPANPGFIGYTGAGVTVDVTDQGVDGTHPAFQGREGSAKSWTGAPVWVDYLGHGTHVAATALGDGGYFAEDAGLPYGLYAGAAPGATLVAQTYNGLAMNYSGMADFASSAGALVSVNSWGDGSSAAQGAYTASAAAYDALTADASASAGLQPLLFVFSAGNLNNAAGSITAPGTAKNVLTLGASGNDIEGGTSSGDVAAFSSFGPTDDGRVKPDLVAPGELLASANSSQRSSGPAGPVPPFAGRSYAYLTGTSQAAPQAAGAAAVAIDYLEEARGVLATPALVKALLINGATPLSGYEWPGSAQGWGRLNLAASLVNSSTRRVDFVAEGYRTFFSAPDVVQYNVSVDAGEELRVTLAWTDAAASPLAAPALVNDLDLEVRDANDTVIFAGNDINRTSATSVPGSGTVFDRTNNVEVVRIPNAASGVWKIFVRAYNLAVAPQSFALAFSGAINRSYADLAVQAPSIRGAPQQIESGETVVVEGEVTNEGAASASGVTVAAVPADDPYAAPYAVFTIPAVAPGERVAFSLSFMPPDGANTITVRVTSASVDADPANNLATVVFFVLRRQPQLSGPTDVVALPGEPAVFTLTAKNAGNALDTLTVAENPAVRDPLWPLSFSHTQFALAPGEGASFQVFVQVPDNASEGDLTIAEVRLVSGLNASRSDYLSLAARAGAVHRIALLPLTPAISAAPGGTEEVAVKVRNAGNAEEAVSVGLTPLWPDAAAWQGASAAMVLAPGASADLRLNLTNTDTGASGYRGSLRVRAVTSSTGETVDVEVPVFVEAVACLRFDPAGELTVEGGASANRSLTLRNCGNVVQSGSITVEAPSGPSVTAPATFAVGPGASEAIAVAVRGGGPDHDLEATILADAGGGLAPSVTFTIHYRSEVLLEAAVSPIRATLFEGVNVIPVVVHNRGASGAVLAPHLADAPSGWSVTVTPGAQDLASDADATFYAVIDTSRNPGATRASMRLLFYPDSPRSGELTIPLETTLVFVATPVPPPVASTTWPSTSTPALVILLGLIAAAASALALAPSRGLLGTCPACGTKAARFDTYMNSRCASCGESLLRSSKRRGEPK